MNSYLRLAILTGAVLAVLGPAPEALAQVVPDKPDFVKAQQPDDAAEVAADCEFTLAPDGDAFGMVVFNNPQNGGTEVDGSFSASVAIQDTTLVFLDDLTRGPDGPDDPDEHLDVAEEGGLEAVIVKCGTLFSTFCFINAPEALMAAQCGGRNAKVNFVEAYWGYKLCPADEVNEQAVFADAFANGKDVDGMIFVKQGAPTELLGCGDSTKGFEVLRCDDQPLDSPFNTACIEDGSAFVANSPISEADTTPPSPPGPGIAISKKKAKQYCNANADDLNLSFSKCLSLFGY